MGILFQVKLTWESRRGSLNAEESSEIFRASKQANHGYLNEVRGGERRSPRDEGVSRQRQRQQQAVDGGGGGVKGRSRVS